MDLNSGYCGDSSKPQPPDHGLIIFAVIGLLVVIMVSFVIKKVVLVKKVGFFMGCLFRFVL